MIPSANDTILTHSGAVFGYTSSNSINLNNNINIILLTNSSSYNLNYVDMSIRSLMLDKNYDMNILHKPIILPAETLDQYVGEYSLTPEVLVYITKKDDCLYIQLTGQNEVKLSAETENRFLEVEGYIEFLRDKDGKVESLILHQNGSDVTAYRN